MFDRTSLTIFILAAMALLITPGPAVLYIVARSMSQGRIAGVVSSLGIGLGSAVHVAFAALGLSALLMQSALAFTIVKYLGAAYLVYLGIRTLVGRTQMIDMKSTQNMNYTRIFSQGFIVNLLNPKTALFFLAFLPQFVNPERGPVEQQIIFLGILLISMGIVSDSIYALAAGTAGEFLSRSKKVAQAQKYFAGTVYILLGITTALYGGSSSK